MPVSIRYQLLIPLIAILAGVIGLGAWTATTAAESAGRRQIEPQVRTMGRTLGEARFPLTLSVLDQIKGLSGADLILVTNARATGTLKIDASQLPAVAISSDLQSLQLGPLAEV